MPTASILRYLSSGMSVDEILADWHDLERGGCIPGTWPCGLCEGGEGTATLEDGLVRFLLNVNVQPSRMSSKWVYNTPASDVAARSASSPCGRGLG